MRLRACVLASIAVASILPAAARTDGVRMAIARHATAHGLPVALADAMVRIESRYNPAARNRANLGLTQISLATARSLGYRGSAAGLMDADTNLRYGILYLAHAHRLSGGNVCGTVMRYQSGLGARRMSGANIAYCGRVRAILAGRA